MIPLAMRVVLRVKGCDGKRRYGSMLVARMDAARLAAGLYDKAPRRRLHAYRCPFCSFWHVGHRAQR